MDNERRAADLTNKSVNVIFTDFMRSFAMLEELANLGEKLLRGFYRELEMLRNDTLPKASSVIDSIIKANYTDKMMEYADGGFISHDNAVQSISKLHSCKLGLEDHLFRAKILIDELQSIKDKAVDKVKNDIDEHFSECIVQSSEFKDAQESLLLDKSMSLATLMILIYGMLKLEFTMQEKIIKSLELKTSSSVLESYCMFWELRPYVDDNVMHQAWKYIS